MLIYLIFLFAFQVQGQYIPQDDPGSGDGISDNSTDFKVPVPLIDDNGDLITVADGIDVNRSTDGNAIYTSLSSGDTVAETTVAITVTDTPTNVSVTQIAKLTVSTTDSPLIDALTTENIMPTTTIIPSTTTTTTESTTTTTTKPVTTTVSVTTTTTVKSSTTKKATTRIPTRKSKQKEATAKNPPTSAPAPTLPMSANSGKRCTFVDSAFQCDVELVCYGEGEIDCSDLDEMDSDEMDETLSSASEDYSDYFSDGKTSETFPIKRIGSNSHKINLFKMFPLGASVNKNSGLGRTEEETSPTSDPSINLTSSTNAELLNGENVQLSHANVTVDDIATTTSQDELEAIGNMSSFSLSTELPKVSEEKQILNSSLPDTASPDTFGEILLENLSVTNLSTVFPELALETTFESEEKYIEDSDFQNQTTTQVPTLKEITTTAVTMKSNQSVRPSTETDKDQPVITRTKREKNANGSEGYYISNYKVSELESSKKKLRIKMCKLSGNLVCSPHATTSMCSGKSLCQAPLLAIETVEKPATPKGLEKWTIAVIVICAITATFTIALLIYLVFTSYKKLKVQPQNGVTTLNYVNSAQP